MENGTFYHSGKSLSAKIDFKINVKLTELTKNGIEVVHKESIAIRINNYFDYITIKRALIDEVNVSKFLCFGGGLTSI
jgi:hypothetical protein